MCNCLELVQNLNPKINGLEEKSYNNFIHTNFKKALFLKGLFFIFDFIERSKGLTFNFFLEFPFRLITDTRKIRKTIFSSLLKVDILMEDTSCSASQLIMGLSYLFNDQEEYIH